MGLHMDIKLMVRDEMFFLWLEKHNNVVGSALHLDEQSLINNFFGIKRLSLKWLLLPTSPFLLHTKHVIIIRL